MMNDSDKRQVEDLIEQRIKRALNQQMETIGRQIRGASEFQIRKVGDTPTDANQLVPKKYVDSLVGSTAFAGSVNSNGTAVFLPNGWTSSVFGAGQYIVTHNLGTAEYAVAITSMNANLTTTNITSIGSASFKLITWDNGFTNADRPFNFVLVLKG